MSMSLPPTPPPVLVPSSPTTFPPALPPAQAPFSGKRPTFSPAIMPNTNPATAPAMNPAIATQPTISPAHGVVVPTMNPATRPTLPPIGVPNLNPAGPPVFVPPTRAPFFPTIPPANLKPTFAPTLASSSPASQPASACRQLSREEALLSILSQYTNTSLLTSLITSEGLAFRWLLATDTSIDPCTYPTIVQRYGLAVYYYATQGDTWTNKTGWLSPEQECQWYGVSCFTGTGVVTDLVLCK